jgi:hypothetical protein
METVAVRTLASDTLEARKKRVRYTAYYPCSTQAPVVLYSGSEQGYKAHAPNYEEMFSVFSGSQLQFSNFMLLNGHRKVVVHKENWDNVGRRNKEPWSCKRAIGDYPRPSEMYQTELAPASFRSSKYED